MRFFSGIVDIVRWPFERAAWSVERWLLWPLRERFAGRSPSSRSVGAAALAGIAGAAVLAGALLLPSSGDGPREQVAAPTRVAIATPEPEAAEPSGRELQGVAPSFEVNGASDVAPAADGADTELDAESESEPLTSDEDAAATSSSKKPVPAGPAAMKVARRFSEAFVFYEIGERPARAKTVFGETATPQLAEALDERPPRQPADAAVPKARVVNLVPGPRAGKAYTVSVSLLRVGLTSELRLELNKKQGQWVVTDVRG